jgi:hypothetical protein
MKSLFVIVTDIEGASCGYGGAFVPITTRIEIRPDGAIVGMDNLAKQIGQSYLSAFINMIASQPRGAFLNRFSWHHE